jgi:beta-apo-4'-carotenal oxygenase
MHAAVPTLPFGGVGESGTGCYHGRNTFDAFVHRRSIVATPGWVERFLNTRYPPYEGKLAELLKTSRMKPNFDREGRENPAGLLAWVVWFLTLGGGANKSGAVRTAAVIIGQCYFPIRILSRLFPSFISVSLLSSISVCGGADISKSATFFFCFSYLS